MLKYKTKTRPSLVALYDIRPGNRAGQFLQPRGPHKAVGPSLKHLVSVLLTWPQKMCYPMQNIFIGCIHFVVVSLQVLFAISLLT